jgi:N-acyl-D-amino-acid deacylase
MIEPQPIWFRNARVIDGTNRPSYWADVAIEAGHICQIESLAQTPQKPHAARPLGPYDVDCSGLVLAPGFIDVHTHDDAVMLNPAPLGQYHAKLSQGVTSVVTGNCGVSLAPLVTQNPVEPLRILGLKDWRFTSFEAYLNELAAVRPSLNVGCLIGHTTLRIGLVKDLSKPANAEEIHAMQQGISAALAAGALGLSTGVYYPPARAADTAELSAVCQQLAQYQVPVTMHLRNESDELSQAMQEAFAVGQQAGCAVVMSHHKVIGSQNAGRSKQSLAALESAAEHQNVCIDCYPYDASSTMLFVQRVSQSRDILITWSSSMPSAAGKMLSALAKEACIAPEEMAKRLLPAGAIYFAMDEQDVQKILSHPLTMIGSDGLAHDQNPHPRLWGSFTRVLGRYSRELKLFPLETAIYKMTGLSASRFGLDIKTSQRRPRGQIQIGWAADLIVFDPNVVIDHATYSQPTAPSSGIKRVYINGQLAALEGRTMAQHAGVVLRNAKFKLNPT